MNTEYTIGRYQPVFHSCSLAAGDGAEPSFGRSSDPGAVPGASTWRLWQKAVALYADGSKTSDGRSLSAGAKQDRRRLDERSCARDVSAVIGTTTKCEQRQRSRRSAPRGVSEAEFVGHSATEAPHLFQSDDVPARAARFCVPAPGDRVHAQRRRRSSSLANPCVEARLGMSRQVDGDDAPLTPRIVITSVAEHGSRLAGGRTSAASGAHYPARKNTPRGLPYGSQGPGREVIGLPLHCASNDAVFSTGLASFQGSAASAGLARVVGEAGRRCTCDRHGGRAWAVPTTHEFNSDGGEIQPIRISRGSTNRRAAICRRRALQHGPRHHSLSRWPLHKNPVANSHGPEAGNSAQGCRLRRCGCPTAGFDLARESSFRIARAV